MISRLAAAEFLDEQPPLARRLRIPVQEFSMLKVPMNPHSQIVHFHATQVHLVDDPSPIAVALKLSRGYFATAVVAGSDHEFLAVGQDSAIKTFSISDWRPIGRARVVGCVTKVVVAPCDPSVIAVCSERYVLILAIRSDGTLEVRQEVQLMLEAVGPDLYVISIDWVPLEPFQLAVTTSAFVKVYDITVDCLSPLSCFEVKDPIVSSTFGVHDDQAYLLVGLAGGRIGLQPVGGANGPVAIQNIITLDASFRLCIVSHSADTGMVFISAPRAGIIVVHLEHLVANPGGSTFAMVPLDCAEALSFVCLHPQNEAIHFLEAFRGGTVCMVEFTDSGIACNQVPSPRLIDGSFGYFSVFPLGNSVAVIAADGCLYTLMTGKPRGGPGIVYDSLVEDDEELKVPPSFWVAAAIEKVSVSVTDSFGRDRSDLLGHKKVMFDGSKVKFIVKSRDPSQAIVGVSIGFTGRGPPLPVRSITVARRRYTLKPNAIRRFQFALRQSEVDPEMALVIELEAITYEIEVSDMDIFVIPCKPKKHDADVDWTTTASDLRVFVDKPEPFFETDIEYIAGALSSATFLECQAADKEAIINLITWIYTKPKFAGFARRIVLKAFGKDPGLEELWAEALGRVCQDGELDAEMAPMFWRDFALLPLEKQRELNESVWKWLTIGSGPHALVAAMIS
jgi:hypothetical protein